MKKFLLIFAFILAIFSSGCEAVKLRGQSHGQMQNLALKSGTGAQKSNNPPTCSAYEGLFCPVGYICLNSVCVSA